MPHYEKVFYDDGTSATGIAPLPAYSPAGAPIVSRQRLAPPRQERGVLGALRGLANALMGTPQADPQEIAATNETIRNSKGKP